MRNKLFKILNGILIVYYLLVTPAAAFAEDPSPEPAAQTTENSQTGSESNNTATTDTSSDTAVTNNNDSTTVNAGTNTQTSGSNTSTDNTGNAEITTGDTTATTTTNTTTNVNTTKPAATPMPYTTWTGSGDWQTRSANTETGSNSTNTASTDNTSNASLTNNNNATVVNAGANVAVTGSNNASNNTGNAAINTGNATTNNSYQTTANLNQTGGAWTGNGDWTNLWSGEGVNYLTGSSSDNSASTHMDQVLTVLNNNGVNVQNLISSFALTGGNVASDNTGNASITTGNASVVATALNLANTNIFGTDSIGVLYKDIYSHNGDIDLGSVTPYMISNLTDADPLQINSENNTTGSDSTNNTSVSGNLMIDFINNNSGSLANVMSLAALTGGNTASDNTGNANIHTGDAEVIANLINMLNTNIYASEVTLGMINVFGEWNGNLILPELNTSAGTYTPLLSLDTLAANSSTGSDSLNDASVNANLESSLLNNNTGTVNNLFDLTGQTGSNTASDNTRDGSIETGETTLDANQATYMNTNIVSESPWWIVLVNNLGNWTAHIMPTSAQVVTDVDTLALGAENSETGSESENTAATNIDASLEVINNNDGVINNLISAAVITGGNVASDNTGSGMIITGDASIMANVVNFLNTNIIAPSFLLTMINVFGDWNGSVVDHGTNAPVITNNSDNNPTIQSVPPSQGGTDNNNGGNNSAAMSAGVSTPIVLASTTSSSSKKAPFMSTMTNNDSDSSSDTTSTSTNEIKVLSYKEESTENASGQSPINYAINSSQQRNMIISLFVLTVVGGVFLHTRSRLKI